MISPDGWTYEKQAEDRIVFKDPTGRQQTTLSVLALRARPTFDEFKLLCSHRLNAERAESSKVFIEGGVPQIDHGKFVCIYSGGNRDTRRMFSSYLTANEQQFTTLYVEGIGISGKDHLETFAFFVEQAITEFT